MTTPATSDRSVDRSGPVDPARPFGAHLVMSWWKPVLMTVVVVGALYLRILFWQSPRSLVRVLGKDPPTNPHPITCLALNLSIILLV